MKKITVCISACILVLIFTASCGFSPPESESEKLSILASNFPAYDFCREIAGDKADISMLLSPGEEAHSFDPTPLDILKLNKADIFVYGGGESDDWVQSILDSSERNITSVKMMDYAGLYGEEIKDGMEIKGEDGEGEDSEEYDEHVWTSPLNAVTICDGITKALCSADSKNAEYYTMAFEEYKSKLHELDSAFRTAIEGSLRKELIFADRFPLLYFVKEYGIDYYAAFPGCSGETEASPATIGFLIKKIQHGSIPYVLKIEMSSDAMAQSIANQTGAEILTFYSCQTVSKADFENGETYLSLMKKNTETLNKALN